MAAGHFALSLVTAPAAEPVTLAEAKTHLRVDATDDDSLITQLIVAARRYCETRQRRAYVTQTWDFFLDAFPDGGGPIRIPRPPLASVTSVKYTDADNVQATVATADYLVDAVSEPGWVLAESSWPTSILRPGNGVEVRFVAGYGGASAVPESTKQAILALAGTMYANRESLVTGTIVSPIEALLEGLLAPDAAMAF